MDLDDFEAAFDAAHPATPLTDAWERTRRAARRQLAVRRRRIAWRVAALALCVAAGLYGVRNAWLVAGFFVLVVIPNARRERRRWLDAFAAVESPGELREVCERETLDRTAGIFASAVLVGGLGVVYLATAGIAHLLDRSAVPGLAAGAIAIAWAVVKIVVVLPWTVKRAAHFPPHDDEQDDDDDA